ncbi:MAG: tetratricopeptide repeat protein, partial [Gammaproteobacteria bacterium]
LQNGAVELAKASLVDALKLDPRNEEAAVQLAGLLMREQRFDRVLEILQPLGAGPSPSRRAQALELQARLALKDWPAAEELAGRVGEQANNPQYKPYVAALALQAQGKHEEAIAAFREVLAAQPDLTGALAGVARSYRERQKPAEAVAAIEAFLRDHPEDLGARQLLATEQLQDGDTAGARQTLERGLQSDPAWLAGYRGLGVAAIREKKPKEAVAAYERALAANPQAVEFKLLAASLLEQGKDLGAAEARYREVLAVNPGVDVAANNLAVILTGDGSNKERLAEAEALARRFQSSEQPFFADTYAWILYLKGDHAKAAEILDRVVRAAPEEAIFQYHLGAALFELNDRGKAKIHLAKAEKLAQEKGKFEGYDAAMALLAKLQ